jgi:ubiquitin-protein ligase
MAKRLQKEFAELNSDPPAYITGVQLIGDNLYKWKLTLIGPVQIYLLLTLFCGI